MSYCNTCQHEIDPDWCWCGDSVESHGLFSGHSPVPMGCQCGYVSSEEEVDELESLRREDTT